MKPYIVGITGASGVVYAVKLIRTLFEMDYPVECVISDAARLVFKEELSTPVRNFNRKEDLEPLFGSKVHSHLNVSSPKDFTAAIASGSYPTSGMIIIPCSMGTLGAIAGGQSGNLIHRAADCTLKEGRKLVLVPRETPLSAIHLENMLKLERLGVRMVPAMPGFYAQAQNISELVDFMVGKVLDQFEIPHALYPRWTGSSAPQCK